MTNKVNIVLTPEQQAVLQQVYLLVKPVETSLWQSYQALMTPGMNKPLHAGLTELVTTVSNSWHEHQKAVQGLENLGCGVVEEVAENA